MVGVSSDVRPVRVRVNGVEHTGLAEPRTLLSDFLRHELGFTGVHVGCEHGVCGACSIRVDGSLVRSCITFAVQVEGADIQTVEGLGVVDGLHPIQQAFQENHGLQCGFCTPGLVLTTQALLDENPSPTEAEIRDYLSGNICRCTGYVGVVASVQGAAAKLSPDA